MMRAIVIRKYGSADVLELRSVPNPTIKADEVLVRIHATSVNPIDWKVRSGKVLMLTGFSPPRIPGADFAGVITEVGRNVSKYEPGDEVWGMVNAIKGGTYAEYLNVKEVDLALKPKSLSFEEAASVPTAGLTAYQSLVHLGKLKTGHHVMINGCSGGVGLAGIQIAKALGCEVTGVCSTRNIKLARFMGADHVIDYTKETALNNHSAYNISFDAVAKQSFIQTRKTMKPGGTYVTTVPSLQSALLGLFANVMGGKTVKMIMVKSNHRDLCALEEMVDSGNFKPVIEQVYALKDAPDAHRRSETGRVAGKLVLKID